MLARSPEYRKNEMIMLEEFRRRKKLKDYYELMRKRTIDKAEAMGEKAPPYQDMD